MDPTSKTAQPAPNVFVIRVTDGAHDHKLLGYAFVQQTAFFPAHHDGASPPEVRITLDGLQQLFDKSAEAALAAIPFATAVDPTSGSITIGANVHGANVHD